MACGRRAGLVERDAPLTLSWSEFGDEREVAGALGASEDVQGAVEELTTVVVEQVQHRAVGAGRGVVGESWRHISSGREQMPQLGQRGSSRKATRPCAKQSWGPGSNGSGCW